ncbi:MAG: carotenoid oxygenase family protein [Sphingopyxis sp.]|uniref:carotenoid oxygenase family protein n=1 Tax=Sphingopyxis sp. TaxID=1908224 RepID=UPI002ABCAB47|nr:carotenoid oxygenase family protein [Sphingopyxis sp.]MDZ3833622.1 carotenoid oxygenase family protein [Sphingopyxis sp.]
MLNSGHGSPYLQGNFAPIRTEDDFELTASGDVPVELCGALYRVGPNPQFEPRDPNYHWFTGDGMMHGFYFENGKVQYRNRYVRTPRWKLEHEAGRSLFGSFGNPMTTDPIARGKDSGGANTHILYQAGKLLALSEAHMPMEVDPVTLETKGYVESYRSRVTAHPKIDPVTGEMIWFAYDSGPGPFTNELSFGITAADGSVTRRDGIIAPFSSMIHDFMVTQDYAMIPVLPLTGSFDRAMGGQSAYAWEPDLGGHIAVMRRDGSGDIRWFNVDSCYVFHVLNAWQEGGKLFADVLRYDQPPLFPRVDGKTGERHAGELMRWTFDLDAPSNAVKEETLDDLFGEFPRIDHRFETRKNVHGWYLGDPAGYGAGGQTAVVHKNLQTGKREKFELGADSPASEPVFVPRSQEAGEGDGYLMTVVYRTPENRSDLLIFEATDLEKGPIATVHVPRRIPYGFHGSWVAGDMG